MRSLRSWLVAGVAVESAAAIVLVATGGSAGGRALRSLLVVVVGTVTVVALRRWSSPRAAAAALPAGLLGMVIGAGVGPRHLTAGGAVSGGAGGVLLVVGTAVTVASGVSVLRATRRWARLWALPAVLAVVVVGVPSAIAVAVSAVPPTPLGDRSPADLGLSAEVVGFPARDGTRLVGWWIPSRNGGAVVVLHGSGSNRASVLDQVAVLADAGYGVLAFDARGHGESEGSGMDLGWYAREDLGGALDLVASTPGVDPRRVGALGLSMGAEEALTVLGDEKLAAVVAEGATRRVAADDGWLPEHPGGVLQRAMDWWQDRVTQVLSGVDPPPSLRSRVRASDTPVLLVAAGRVPDELSAALWLQRARPETVEVWEVPGADHTGGLARDPDGWTRRVVGFFDRTLGR